MVCSKLYRNYFTMYIWASSFQSFPYLRVLSEYEPILFVFRKDWADYWKPKWWVSDTLFCLLCRWKVSVCDRFFNRSYGFMVVCKSVHLYLVNQFFLGICSLVFSEILHMDYQWQTDFPEKILFALKWPPIFFEF